MNRAAGCVRAFSSCAVNGRSYTIPQANTSMVAILLDGNAPEYIEVASAKGAMKNWNEILSRQSFRRGEVGLVQCVVPTFTNPNNVAVVTGSLPNVNGICGNYLFDEETNQEVMMNDTRFLRCGTILAEMNKQGVEVSVVTAKDKLLKLLSHGLTSNSTGFSVEKANDPSVSAQLMKYGVKDIVSLMTRPSPPIYGADASLFCLEAGVQLLRRRLAIPSMACKPAMYYLSTTDYIQHKHQPDSQEAIDFYRRIDSIIGELDQMGAVIGITGDHGMNDKVKADGSPNVVYLEDLLRQHGVESRVILPITDPYVVHHGALGSYATIYVSDKSQLSKTQQLLSTVPGVEAVYLRSKACELLGLPGDRIGDIVVLGDRCTVLGRTPAIHDLTQVPYLRSHGGMHEAIVPLFINRPLKPLYKEKLKSGSARNWDLFDFLCNGLE